MKVKELVERLKNYDPDKEVNVWADCGDGMYSENEMGIHVVDEYPTDVCIILKD